MDFKKSQIITEETIKDVIEMYGQCDCACQQEIELETGQCSDCACEIVQDCACEMYKDC